LETALLARWMIKVDQTAMTDQALNLQYRRGLRICFQNWREGGSRAPIV